MSFSLVTAIFVCRRRGYHRHHNPSGNSPMHYCGDCGAWDTGKTALPFDDKADPYPWVYPWRRLRSWLERSAA